MYFKKLYNYLTEEGKSEIINEFFNELEFVTIHGTEYELRYLGENKIGLTSMESIEEDMLAEPDIIVKVNDNPYLCFICYMKNKYELLVLINETMGMIITDEKEKAIRDAVSSLFPMKLDMTHTIAYRYCLVDEYLNFDFDMTDKFEVIISDKDGITTEIPFNPFDEVEDIVEHVKNLIVPQVDKQLVKEYVSKMYTDLNEMYYMEDI